MNKQYYVYILSNWENLLLYVGFTNDLMRRVTEHKQNTVEGFTKKYHINKLVYYEETNDVYSAIERENKLNPGPERKKLPWSNP